MLHGTRVYQARVPQFFLITQIPTQQCHGGRTDEELEFLKLEF